MTGDPLTTAETVTSGEPRTTSEPPPPGEPPPTDDPPPTNAPAPAPTPTDAAPIPGGTPVRDTARNRIGVVMDHQGPYFQLRPLDGGREWDAAPEDVRPVGPGEVLRARVADANQRSRRGRNGAPE
ncbi:hypothetical protein [Streptomyces sp. TS71-3]|uniref:hypothetical protein n=1 Tax=Streptomyces sp. TS71-3 TaxID=2733862 RepID=UPI001B029A0E|nr:hypothetical protein [Streptomyces sp. TS71-3]GHJ36004.1 hypothetical protein Sm713_16130 [Streptomyces sp. TS71-3]